MGWLKRMLGTAAPTSDRAPARGGAADEWWPEKPAAVSQSGLWRLDLLAMQGEVRARVVGPQGEHRLSGLTRPILGAVDDSGRALIFDGSFTKFVGGTVVAFDSAGHRLAEHKIRPNVEEVATDCGAGLAFLLMAPADGRLFAFRFEDGALLWKTRYVGSFDLRPQERVVLIGGAGPNAIDYDTGKRVALAELKRRGFPRPP